jgi:hypothetical protein
MADFSAFVGGSYKAQSPVTDNEELYNFFVEVSESPGATAQASLSPTPGVQPFAIAPASGGRAMFASVTTSDPIPSQEGRCFAVYGNRFVEVFANGTTIQRGVVAVDENPATISTNGYGSADTSGRGQLVVTSGGIAYCYELATDVLTQITTLSNDGVVATQGACVNGYFLIFDRNSSTMYMSFLLDGSRWDLSQYFQPSIITNPWQAMAVSPFGQIILPGVTNGEIWYNAGTFPIPFAPDLSGLLSYGCVATFSITVVGETVMWLAKTPDGGIQVMQLQGYRPQRVSTHALEFQGASYPRVNDAIGQAYTEQGHTFYLLTFPTANVTWGYDEKAPEGRRWHKRGTWISEASVYHYFRPVFHAFAFNMHLMADRESARIYQMSSALPRDVDDRVIRRLRQSPTVQNENMRIVLTWFELLLQTGIGQDAAPFGPPPTVMLRVSKDGGRTWGDERQASAGALGAYLTRVYWARITQGRQTTFEVTVSDAVRNWRITAAYLRTPQGQGA